MVWQIDRLLDHDDPNKVYGSQRVFGKVVGGLRRELTSMKKKRGSWVGGRDFILVWRR
jgi:hypothetical protein